MIVVETKLLQCFELFLLFGCPLAALLLVARGIAAFFSGKVRAQVQKHPVIHCLWGVLALVGLLVFLGVVSPDKWPLWVVERAVESDEQRTLLAERLRAAGGWAAIQRDCDALAERHRKDQFQWFRGFDTNSDINTGPLPPAVAALNPQEVKFESPEILSRYKNHEAPQADAQIPIVHIKLFGMHRTGRPSSPYLGLQVICATNAGSYQPGPDFQYEHVADRTFEVH